MWPMNMNLETEQNFSNWLWFLLWKVNFIAMNRVSIWIDNFSLNPKHAIEYEISIRKLHKNLETE